MLKKLFIPILPVAALGIGTVLNSVQPYSEGHDIKINRSAQVTTDGQVLLENQTVFTFDHDNFALYDSFWFAKSKIEMTIPGVPTLTAQFTQKFKFTDLLATPRVFYDKPYFFNEKRGTAQIKASLSIKKNAQNYEIILGMQAVKQLTADPYFDVRVLIPEFTYNYKGSN